MPIYEFLCKSCNEIYEEFQSVVATKPTITCPNCGRPAAKKPSAVSFHDINRIVPQLGTQLKRQPRSYRDLKDLMGDGELVSKDEYFRHIKRDWNYDQGNARKATEEGIREANEKLQNIEYVRKVNTDIINQKNWDLVKGAGQVPTKE